MNSILPHQLIELNKSNKELVQILSPDIGSSNVYLFSKKSDSQPDFCSELRKRNIGIANIVDPKLDNRLQIINEKVISHIEKNKNVSKTKLDLDIAKIFHENLPLARRCINQNEFWRTIELFYFIEITKWRWEKDPSKPENWYSNSKSIFGRALGLYLNEKKYKDEKTIVFSSRSKRIDAYRFWWIGQRFYDPVKKYYYLEKISEKYKEEEGSLQDFLNLIEGNTLLSPSDRISKILANQILLSDKKYSEKEARDCFTRYNAFKRRQLMDADEKIIAKEICLAN